MGGSGTGVEEREGKGGVMMGGSGTGVEEREGKGGVMMEERAYFPALCRSIVTG